MLFVQQKENIGQVNTADADNEIERLRLQGSGIYVKDYSKQMFTYDQPENENFFNPCTLSKGNCWVIKKTAQEKSSVIEFNIVNKLDINLL